MSYVVESETVLNSITSLLRSVFTTTEIPCIYKGKVVEGMSQPCIVVKQVNLTDYKQMTPHHSLRYIIDIRFHPNKKDPEFEEWGRTLAYRALQSLQADLKIYNQKINFWSTEMNLIDDVTHLTLIFSFFIREQRDETPDPMEKLLMSLELKNN